MSDPYFKKEITLSGLHNPSFKTTALKKKYFSQVIIAMICLFTTVVAGANPSAPGKKQFFQFKVYHVKSNEQVKQVDQFLKAAYLPALHRAGLQNIGVLKPIANDTAAMKAIYVFIPFTSANEWAGLNERLKKDAVYQSAAKDFIVAASDHPPYERLESILMEAFAGQEQVMAPASQNAERVFELRSYESPTEELHRKKTGMFETGGEISIFDRLGFHPVFYARVISGTRMPNLMYMPVFDNMHVKDSLWDKFRNDPKWKEMSTAPENENKVSVSHIDSIVMHSTEYSDF